MNKGVLINFWFAPRNISEPAEVHIETSLRSDRDS